jgi:Arc/MetJ family transcription regulator
MTKTLIDVDDVLLRQAQQILGTPTKKETVNSALREIVRRTAAADLMVMARDGIFGPDEVEP